MVVLSKFVLLSSIFLGSLVRSADPTLQMMSIRREFSISLFGLMLLLFVTSFGFLYKAKKGTSNKIAVFLRRERNPNIKEWFREQKKVRRQTKAGAALGILGGSFAGVVEFLELPTNVFTEHAMHICFLIWIAMAILAAFVSADIPVNALYRSLEGERKSDFRNLLVRLNYIYSKRDDCFYPPSHRAGHSGNNSSSVGGETNDLD